MFTITLCPSCGSDRIEQVCQDWIRQYQGKNYIVPELEFYDCPDCGEKVYDRQAMRKIEAYSPAFAHLRLKKEVV
jgi:YgiT-type zinc finger domain-containing protein